MDEVTIALSCRDNLRNHGTIARIVATIRIILSLSQEEEKSEIARVKSTDAKQEATIANQQKQIAALTAGLQKVSTQLELSRPAPHTVTNNR